MINKALVLAMAAAPALPVIRSLARGGVRPHLGWSVPDGGSLRSRYLAQDHALPCYSDTDFAWKQVLIDLMKRERFDLVIPCSDIDTLACHRHRSDLEQHGRVYCPNDEACAILFDKFRTNDLARAAGVPVPREVVVNTADEARCLSAEFGFPLVLKPRQTFDLASAAARPSVRKAYSENEFCLYLEEMLSNGPVAVQQNFIGHGTGVELLLDRGEPLLTFQHVRVHEPLHGGPSSYRKSVSVSAELVEAALAILRRVKYTGVAMVEFKVNPRTGTWVFIEVNARFWGSLPLAVAAGADFPLALFRFCVDGQRRFSQRYRKGLCCRNWPLDLEWQLANLHADRADPTLATLPLYRVLAETLANVLTLRERSDTWTLDDPGPGFAEMAQLAGRLCKRASKSLPWLRPAAGRALSAKL